MGHTAIDIAKLNATDDMAGLVEVNKNVAPELSLVPAFTIKGTSFTGLKRLSVPSGGFKPLGGGVAVGKNQYENALIQCFNYANPLQETVDRCKSYRKGEAAFLALAASGAVKGAFELIGRSLYYGARALGGGTDAFPGLIDLYDSTNKVVDAGGTTDSTCSSVWFLKFGNMEDGNISFVFGDDRVLALGDWIKQQVVVNATLATVAMAWVNEIAAAPGVQLMDSAAAVRIKKLTEDNGKGMTDALGYTALGKFPSGMTPDVALMTRRSVAQLRVSRASATGVRSDSVEWPTSVAGVRIVETDSISNVETLAL
jgi:hypothetical protein